MWYTGQNAQGVWDWREFLNDGYMYKYNSKDIQYFVLQSKEKM